MVVYRVMAAYKLWDLLRNDNDGLVKDPVVQPPDLSGLPVVKPRIDEESSCQRAWKGTVAYFTRSGYPGSWWRVLLQLLDLELFHILYVSIVVGLDKSSAPQRMLKVYEAVFEAAPQVCLHSNFVY